MKQIIHKQLKTDNISMELAMPHGIMKYVKSPDAISMAGLLFGIFSIFLSLWGYFTYAALFILVTGMFDYLDGKLSRRINRENNFGVYVDSLNDLVNYMITVVIFGYAVGLSDILSAAVFFVFVMCGILRLARFNLVHNIKEYDGLPTTYAIMIPIIYLVLSSLNINVYWLLLFYIVPAILMISNIKFPKI